MIMTSKERFLSAMNYRGYDRAPTTYYGTPEIHGDLMEHFGLEELGQLQDILGDDLRTVSPRYIGPPLEQFADGSWEGLWGERYANISFGHGTYPEAIYLPYADIEELEQLDALRRPSPDWFAYDNIAAECDGLADKVICVGDSGTPDFLNGIARCRGVEQVLLDVGLEDPVYLRLMAERFEFQYEKMRRALEAGQGKIDVLHLGEDYGNQNGLMFAPVVFDKLFAPYMRQFFDLAHRYGARSMMHCCGSCYDLIPRLIDIGLDILEVVQVDAAKMDIRDLHREFYGKIAFCGSISVQSTLPFGTVDDVVREVRLRQELFRDGGMIIAPTHAIQAGTPVANIVALYKTIGSLRQ